ncbi:MAG TPA: flavin reductase family protein [Cyclobacteriaceae bacterium]|jgi:flavin reductase (DIM6/NTAB) family NADH-FMN oxidoreductase RutF|nr:flavin reductase family protein [Cytophagales bacterium]HNT50941.1 flavin reductase family protein [Cyclobacteriaceae bacterium]HRE66737.1 flavin reductase family protein [Cyclobacteriaceae bacterium]HRF33551.1 flavin reductase family protein [Cyclobacteriaceae bacterium]
MIIKPSDLPIPRLQAYLQSAITPRPIAFVSSIDTQGHVNLSPFSFFNMFSMNPPILIFSPSRRVRDNTTKHTLQNVQEVPEVTINIVSYNMVEQTSLASCEFPKGVNEFVKAGFTEISSQLVRPPYVAESPVSFECRVKQVLPLGESGGAGNLVICEVLLMHIQDAVLDTHGMIDPHKLDVVARMGKNFYSRVQGESIFEVAKPNEKIGIGYDAIPETIRNSTILTGNDLGRLGNIEKLPEGSELAPMRDDPEWLLASYQGEIGLHQLAKRYLSEGKITEAWKVLLAWVS